MTLGWLNWTRNVLLLGLIGGAALLSGCINPSHRRLGDEAWQRGDYGQVETHYTWVIREKDPSDYVLLYRLGKAQVENGRPNQAELTLRDAWALRDEDPEITPDILDALAQALYDQPDNNEELFAFLQDTADRYNTPRDFMRQGKYLALIGDVDNAQVAYRKAVYFAENDDTQTLEAMGDFYQSLGDFQNAERFYLYAFSLDPRDTDIRAKLEALGVVPGPSIMTELPTELRPRRFERSIRPMGAE